MGVLGETFNKYKNLPMGKRLAIDVGANAAAYGAVKLAKKKDEEAHPFKTHLKKVLKKIKDAT